MALAAWAACCFAIALAGTWLARRYALRAGMLDHPGEPRRIHAMATPRGGGIAIVAAVLPVFAMLCLGDARAAPTLLPAGAGLLLVAGIGWWDDHRSLSVRLRLAVHAVAAALLAWGLHAGGANDVVAACGFALALVLVNVWNFMDGIDGLAASQALVAALAYALFAGTDAATILWLGVALAAGCAGFLPFNLPRARIFLGDAGSGALGYLLAMLAALSALSLQPTVGALPLALLLPLPLLAFGVDASLTLVRRVLRGERWWEGHAQHAYQVQARRWGHGRVAAGFLAWTVAASMCMIAAKRAPAPVMMFLTVAAVVLTCMAWKVLQAAGGADGQAQPGRSSEA